MNLDPKSPEYYAEIRRYTRLLKTFPGNTHVLALRASCRFWHADWRKAANDFEQLTKADSDNAEYWGMLGQACAHGRLPEKAIAACTRAIELDPDFENFYMHRAWAFCQLKQWEASIADYTIAQEIDLKHRATLHSTGFLVELYLKLGEYEKAAELSTLVIKFGTWGDRFYRYRGIAYMKMKQYEKVIENATACIKTGWSSPGTYMLKQRAIAYKELKDFAKAAADFALLKQLEDANRKEYEEDQSCSTEEAPGDMNNEENEETIRQITEEIGNCPNNAEIRYNRGLVYYENYDFKAAAKDFTVAIRLNRTYAAAYSLRAECFYELGQYARALQDIDAALSLDPKISEAYNTSARIYNILGDTEKEIATLEKYWELYPEKTLEVNNLGKLYEATDRYEKAAVFHSWYFLQDNYIISSFPCLLGRNMDAYYDGTKIRKLSAVLANDPENAAIYFIRGKTYENNSQLENAVADYTKAIDIKPDFLIAYIYRALANLDLMYKVLSDLREKDGIDHGTELEKMEAAYKKTEAVFHEKMIADYTQVLKLNDNLPKVHGELGRMYKEAGDYESAVACFNRALELNPDFREIYFLRFEVFELMGNYRAAIEDITRYLNGETHPLSYEPACRGDLYFKMAEYNNAVEDYSTAIEIEKKSSTAFSLSELLEKRARCYQALNENEKARADYTAVVEIYSVEIKLNPVNAENYYYRGLAYKSLGDTAMAKSDFETAVRLYPDQIKYREELENGKIV
jgi:tetratricopeptide (TPR) repeat protein